MAVVVDPRRLDPHHRGDERGEKHGFEIETIEHGDVPAFRRAQDPAEFPSIDRKIGEFLKKCRALK